MGKLIELSRVPETNWCQLMGVRIAVPRPGENSAPSGKGLAPLRRDKAHLILINSN